MRKWYWLAALTVALDQLTKWLCSGLTAPVTLVPGVLGLRYAENTGMAFSLFSGRPWLLGIISGVCILLGWRVLRRFRLGRLSRAAAMLMLGGALGNMIDRLLRGYVIDMFEVLLFDFAVFNVADAALTIGAALMAGALLFCDEDWRGKHDGSKSDHPGS